MKVKQIRALIKSPGEEPRTEYVDNTVSNFQEIMGGEYLIASVLGFDVALFFINNAKNKYNCKIFNVELYGTILFTSTTPQGVPKDITDEDVSFVKRYIIPPNSKNKGVRAAISFI